MTAIIIIAVLAVIIVIVALILFGMYNGLIRSRNRVKEAWSGIDVQLRRRASLVPNLVETVKGYASHERETFEEVTRARSAVEQAGSIPDAAAANNMLTGALRHLLDRKSTRLNSSHEWISYAVFCLKNKMSI